MADDDAAPRRARKRGRGAAKKVSKRRLDHARKIAYGLQLLSAGYTTQQIADARWPIIEETGEPAENARRMWNSRQAAHKVLLNALRTIKSEFADDAREVIDMQAQAVFAAMFPQAQNGDPDCAMAAMKALEFRARLHGVFAPEVQEQRLTGAGGKPLDQNAGPAIVLNLKPSLVKYDDPVPTDGSSSPSAPAGP